MKEDNTIPVEEPIARKKSMKKLEIIIILCLLLSAVAAWIILKTGRDSVDYGKIRITVGGEIMGEYDLSKDQRIDINGTNTARILNGEAKMIEASCPDHICLGQLPIDEKGGMIICLPNKVFIEGIPPEGSDEDAPDATAG